MPLVKIIAVPPIYHDCAQYSEEYERLKLGLPTASNFHRILSPKQGKPSAQWRSYACHLIAERALLRKVDTYTSAAMERGLIVEAEAVEWYEWSEGVETQPIGFITDAERSDWPGRNRDATGTMGCTPDRLIGAEGLLEIKCPLPQTQVQYWLSGEVDKTYWSQLQGQLYVSQRKFVHIVSWHAELPRVIIPVERDEPFLRKLEDELGVFINWLDTVTEKLAELGERGAAPAGGLAAALRARLEIVP